MEKYHISVDSGGSKVKAILCDENFRIVSEATSGSVRRTYHAPEICERHLGDLMHGLFDGHEDIRHIASIHGVMEHEITQALCSRCTVDRALCEGEGGVGLAAAGISGSGLLCLSGTGAVMYYINRETGRGGHAGGFGAVVFDEGSGYHIGRMACAAAIRSYEGFGGKTLLEPILAEHFGHPDCLEDALSDGVYGPTATRGPIYAVASIAPLVGRAAHMGDAAALEILTHAGQCLGAQMNALIRRKAVPESIPMTISGGAYRSHPEVYRSLCETIRRENPDRPIILPIFEPVVGALLCEWFAQGRTLDGEALDFWKSEYRNYIYTIGEN